MSELKIKINLFDDDNNDSVNHIKINLNENDTKKKKKQTRKQTKKTNSRTKKTKTRTKKRRKTKKRKQRKPNHKHQHRKQQLRNSKPTQTNSLGTPLDALPKRLRIHQRNLAEKMGPRRRRRIPLPVVQPNPSPKTHQIPQPANPKKIHLQLRKLRKNFLRFELLPKTPTNSRRKTLCVSSPSVRKKVLR